MLRSLFYSIINVVIPMRVHEARVEHLTLEALEALRHHDGLPYHEPQVTSLVWELKYKANPHALALAGAFLSEELLDIASEELGKVLVVPVPMHAERKKLRGYNQTELLCEAALKNLSDSFEYRPEALMRIRNSVPQQTLIRSTRLHNVKGSMQATDPSTIKGRACVVVDDVSTTGATLLEAARALKRAGAARVYTIALARS
jgi:ComF family protein